MKKLILLVLLACFGFAASAQSTLVTLVSNNSLCADSVQPVSVSYSDAVTTFQSGNVFTVQLSDPQGAFANPLAIGSLAGTASSGIIQALVPTWAAGNGYRIRVVSSAPAITGSDNGTDLTIVPLPQVWVSPSQASICPGG